MLEIETRGRSESSRPSRRIIPERNRGRISGRRFVRLRAGGNGRGVSEGEETPERSYSGVITERWRLNRLAATRGGSGVTSRSCTSRAGTDASRVFWTVLFRGGEPVEGGRFPF